jgi:hypothetical protein
VLISESEIWCGYRIVVGNLAGIFGPSGRPVIGLAVTPKLSWSHYSGSIVI